MKVVNDSWKKSFSDTDWSEFSKFIFFLIPPILQKFLAFYPRIFEYRTQRLPKYLSNLTPLNLKNFKNFFFLSLIWTHYFSLIAFLWSILNNLSFLLVKEKLAANFQEKNLALLRFLKRTTNFELFEFFWGQ